MWWPTATVVALILYAVLTPDPPAPPDGLELFEGADKVVHACMMATLCAVAIFDRRRGGLSCRPAGIAATALWVMAFGVVTEILQGTLTQVRSADPADVLADWGGTVVAALVVPALLKRRSTAGSQPRTS